MYCILEPARDKHERLTVLPITVCSAER